MLSVISITIIVISEGTENDWRSLEGFTAEMPLGLSSQIVFTEMERERRVFQAEWQHVQKGTR